MAQTRRTLFLKRRMRNRNKIKKMANGRTRLCVHRSSKNISVQLIDDVNGTTIASASSLEKALGVIGKNNVEASAKVGAAIAERAKKLVLKPAILIVGGLYSMAKLKHWLMQPARVVCNSKTVGGLWPTSMIRGLGSLGLVFLGLCPYSGGQYG